MKCIIPSTGARDHLKWFGNYETHLDHSINIKGLTQDTYIIIYEIHNPLLQVVSSPKEIFKQITFIIISNL